MIFNLEKFENSLPEMKQLISDYKYNDAIKSIENEKIIKELANNLKKQNNNIMKITDKIMKSHNISSDIKEYLTDTTTDLINTTKNAEYEVELASQKRIIAVRSAKISNKQVDTISKLKLDLVNLKSNNIKSNNTCKTCNTYKTCNKQYYIIIILILSVILAYRNKLYIKKNFNINL